MPIRRIFNWFTDNINPNQNIDMKCSNFFSILSGESCAFFYIFPLFFLLSLAYSSLYKRVTRVYSRRKRFSVYKHFLISFQRIHFFGWFCPWRRKCLHTASISNIILRLYDIFERPRVIILHSFVLFHPYADNYVYFLTYVIFCKRLKNFIVKISRYEILFISMSNNNQKSISFADSVTIYRANFWIYLNGFRNFPT